MLRIPNSHIDRIIIRGKFTRNDIVRLVSLRAKQSFMEWTPDLYSFYWQGLKMLRGELLARTTETDSIETVKDVIKDYASILDAKYMDMWVKRGEYSHFGINHFYRWLAVHEFILLIEHIQHRIECDKHKPDFACGGHHHGHRKEHGWDYYGW